MRKVHNMYVVLACPSRPRATNHICPANLPPTKGLLGLLTYLPYRYIPASAKPANRVNRVTDMHLSRKAKVGVRRPSQAPHGETWSHWWNISDFPATPSIINAGVINIIIVSLHGAIFPSTLELSI